MSDENADNKPLEKPTVVKPQEVSQEIKPQEKPVEGRTIELSESFAGKTEAGNQGISLKPLGSHDTNPFASQDASQSQHPSSQTIIPQPTPPAQSSGSDGNADE